MQRLDTFKNSFSNPAWQLTSLTLLLCLSSSTVATDLDRKTTQQQNSANFVLTIDQQRISLQANNASIKNIVEQIGEKLNIQVEANISESDRITTEFENLLLEAVIKRLSEDHAFISDMQGQKIYKIILYPKGGATPEAVQAAAEPDKSTRRDSTPRAKSKESFQFEFDPMATMRKPKPTE